MSEQGFEWDEAKNQENQRKHGVTFYEAQHAFLDQAVLSLKIWSITKPKKGIIVLV